jgi:ABC-type Mn2+/Zn2+ transport system ATPase subunit
MIDVQTRETPLPALALVPALPAIEVTDLRVRYERTNLPALDGVSLRVQTRARVALVGANGSGKSTLLKSIVGLLPTQSGRIQVGGSNLSASRRRVAYLPQVGELDWRFPVSVHRLVMTGRYVHLSWWQRPGRRDAILANEALARVGVADLAERQIGQLSGGQRQRVLLARALAQQADILLLDEPFNAVDAESRTILLRVLDEVQADGATLVIATHDLDRISLHPTELIHLHHGRVVTPDELRRELEREVGLWTD